MISHKGIEIVTESDGDVEVEGHEITCEDFVKKHTKVIPGPRRDLFAMVLGAMPVIDGVPE